MPKRGKRKHGRKSKPKPTPAVAAQIKHGNYLKSQWIPDLLNKTAYVVYYSKASLRLASRANIIQAQLYTLGKLLDESLPSDNAYLNAAFNAPVEIQLPPLIAQPPPSFRHYAAPLSSPLFSISRAGQECPRLANEYFEYVQAYIVTIHQEYATIVDAAIASKAAPQELASTLPIVPDPTPQSITPTLSPESPKVIDTAPRFNPADPFTEAVLLRLRLHLVGDLPGETSSMGEPRARIGKNRGQQQFSNEELSQLLFAHGDVPNPLDPTYRILDQILTEFITSLAFETARAASTAGRQKIKLEDVMFACRKHPRYLGRMEEMLEKKKGIELAKKAFDESDDRLERDLGDDDVGGISKGRRGKKRTLKEAEQEEEELGEQDDLDDDLEDARTVGGRSMKME